MNKPMTAAERVRRSRWAGQVEAAANKLHELLLEAPIPMPREPVIHMDLIEGLIELSGYEGSSSVEEESTPKVQFQAPERNQRDWMKEIAEELGYDQEAAIKRYAELDEQGVAPRKRRTMPSEDYAAALWQDGIKKGWLGIAPLVASTKIKSGTTAERDIMRETPISTGGGNRRYSNKEIQMKISEGARSLPSAELERLCDDGISKELFGLNFPLFVRVPESASHDQRQRAIKTPDKRSRWTWKFEFSRDGYSYAICTQWYPKSDALVSRWLDGITDCSLTDHYQEIRIKPTHGIHKGKRQMTRKPYDREDIVLCTYLARFGPALLTETKVANYGGRSAGSVKMKVQNIVAMLDDKGIERCSDVAPLSGRPP